MHYRIVRGKEMALCFFKLLTPRGALNLLSVLREIQLEDMCKQTHRFFVLKFSGIMTNVQCKAHLRTRNHMSELFQLVSPFENYHLLLFSESLMPFVKCVSFVLLVTMIIGIIFI